MSKEFKYPPHSYGLQLESTLRRVFNEDDRGGFGGIADADFCERNPLTAVVSALARVYYGEKRSVVNDFISDLYFDIGKSIAEIGEEEIQEIISKFKDLVE